jgi:hypothetical protein
MYSHVPIPLYGEDHQVSLVLSSFRWQKTRTDSVPFTCRPYMALNSPCVSIKCFGMIFSPHMFQLGEVGTYRGNEQTVLHNSKVISLEIADLAEDW